MHRRMVVAGGRMTQRQSFALALAPMLVVVVVRFLSPSDLDDNDQALQTLYALDVWERGNWILPTAQGTFFATKPPLYTWLAVIASVPAGGPNAFTCALPSALCVLGIAALVFIIGRERWDDRIGFAAAWIVATSHTLITLSVHVRPDALLGLLVTLALFAMHRAQLGRLRGMPTLFWMATALSALVKGPVGPLLTIAGALLLTIVEHWRPAVRAILCNGAAFWLFVPIAWLGLAYIVGGNAYIKGVVLSHTVDRSLGKGTFSGQGHAPGYLVAQFLGKNAPWSLFALIGAVFAWKGRNQDAPRRHLLLAAAWFVPGLLMLSLPAGQREDYLMPVLPGAALVAAVMLLDRARIEIRQLWSGMIWIGALAMVLLGLSSVSGVTIGSKWLARLATYGGVAWGIPVLIGAALLVVSRVIRTGDELKRIMIATAGLLLVHLAYTFTVSPVAITGWGRSTVQFVEAVKRTRGPSDQLEFHTSLFNAPRFLLRENKPSIETADVRYLLARDRRDGRLLLAAMASECHAIEGRWPGRFVRIVEEPYGREPKNAMVLVELVR